MSYLTAAEWETITRRKRTVRLRRRTAAHYALGPHYSCYSIFRRGETTVRLAHLNAQDLDSINQSTLYWATVCKTVRPMLCDHFPVCLSVLSVTMVYCGQTARWIKMPLGTEIDLGPGDIALDENLDPPHRKGHNLSFSTYVYCRYNC